MCIKTQVMCGKGGDDSEGATLGPRGPCPQVYILTPKKKNYKLLLALK